MEERIRNETEAVKAHFREVGLRWTRPRQEIVDAAFGTHEHFSAEDLLHMIRARNPETGVHLATVYRTLQVLEEGDFIEGLDVGKGSRLFEHTFGHEHHDHIICEDCGRICEFHDENMESLKDRAAQDFGFTMKRHSLRIYGACNDLAAGACEHFARRGRSS
ncbi:MAG: transcriptional repressor [Planctomycetes bacterium]|nr:transcriptional repressor [Planctomycetota bacterium]